MRIEIKVIPKIKVEIRIEIRIKKKTQPKSTSNACARQDSNLQPSDP